MAIGNGVWKNRLQNDRSKWTGGCLQHQTQDLTKAWFTIWHWNRLDFYSSVVLRTLANVQPIRLPKNLTSGMQFDKWKNTFPLTLTTLVTPVSYCEPGLIPNPLETATRTHLSCPNNYLHKISRWVEWGGRGLYGSWYGLNMEEQSMREKITGRECKREWWYSMQGGECELYTAAYRVLRFRMAWCDAISSIRFPWKSLRMKNNSHTTSLPYKIHTSYNTQRSAHIHVQGVTTYRAALYTLRAMWRGMNGTVNMNAM